MNIKFKLVHQFLIFAMVVLVMILVLALFQRSDDAASSAIIEEQNHWLTAKKRLGGIEKTLLLSRQDDLQMSRATNKETLFASFSNQIEQVTSSLEQLKNATKDPDIGDLLEITQKLVVKYEASVLGAIAVQKKMGTPFTPGLTMQLRDLEDHIGRLIAPLNLTELGTLFFQMRLLERDFGLSLDMNLASALMEKSRRWAALVETAALEEEKKTRLRSLCENYQGLVKKLMDHVLESELLLAQNELRFLRTKPNLEKVQDAMDQKIHQASQLLLLQRKVAQQKNWTVFAVAFIILFILILIQLNTAQILVARLKLLANNMIEVGEGHYAIDSQLPSGKDEVGVLAGTFSQMAARIKNQILTIEKERAKAEAANLTKSQFLANMSHEIRTPMSGVLGMLDVLQETELTPDQLESIQTIRESSTSLLDLIDDILDLSKIEAKELVLKKKPFSLNHCVASTIKLFNPKALEKKITLTYRENPAIPKKLMGDPTRVRQVLNNLIGNALKFTHTGSVDVEVVPLEIKAETVNIKISVRDTGIGIPSSSARNVFQPFVQVDASSTRNYGGSGLGLSICHMLVNLMGGEIGFHSEEGKGSHFFITVAFSKVPESDSALEGSASLNSGFMKVDSQLSSKIPLRILLADDHRINQKVALKIFEQMGYTPDSAWNGKQAAKMALDNHYDLIFMDVQMPEMDGLDATRRILSSQLDVMPVIIALTANAAPKDVQECLAAGMSDFISKPYSAKKLQATITKWGNHFQRNIGCAAQGPQTS